MPFHTYGDPVVFGRLVREQRLLRGMTQNALVHAVGIAPSILCRIEHGRRAWAAPQVEAWLRQDEDRLLQAHVTLKARVLEVLATSHRVQMMLL